jgi:hypothetical protein
MIVCWSHVKIHTLEIAAAAPCRNISTSTSISISISISLAARSNLAAIGRSGGGTQRVRLLLFV